MVARELKMAIAGLKYRDLPPSPPPLTFFHACAGGHHSSLLSRPERKEADKRCLGRNNSFLLALKFACKDRVLNRINKYFLIIMKRPVNYFYLLPRKGTTFLSIQTPFPSKKRVNQYFKKTLPCLVPQVAAHLRL
jgi:hypothetical protein